MEYFEAIVLAIGLCVILGGFFDWEMGVSLVDRLVMFKTVVNILSVEGFVEFYFLIAVFIVVLFLVEGFSVSG